MDEYEAAEKELQAATQRLTHVQTRSWDGHGSPGSHERAAAINRAELQANVPILAAIRKMARIDPTRHSAHATAEVIARLEADIARNRFNIERYGGSPH